MSTPLSEVFAKFRVHYYRDVFSRIRNREMSLSAVEVYCVETIHALGSPTINEFANYLRISSPNATYKVNSLVRKGYIRKIQSRKDKREYYLEVTDRFYRYWNLNERYLDIVDRRLKDNLSPEEYTFYCGIVEKISRELMPETGLDEAFFSDPDAS